MEINDAHCYSRMDLLEKRLDELHNQLHQVKKDMNKGFPYDDPVTHRTVHEGYIKEAEIRQKIKVDVLTHIAKGTAWAVVGFIGLAVWMAIKAEILR